MFRSSLFFLLPFFLSFFFFLLFLFFLFFLFFCLMLFWCVFRCLVNIEGAHFHSSKTFNE